MYFRAVYLKANGTILDTSVPLMVFEDEIVDNASVRNSAAHGLLCGRNSSSTTLKWYHPYNSVVQTLKARSGRFAQIYYLSGATKLVYTPTFIVNQDHPLVYGIYTCRLSANIVEAIGVFRRHAGKALATPKNISCVSHHK